MMRFGLASRDRRTVMAGGIVILSILVMGRGAPAWNRWRTNAEESSRSALVEVSEARRSVSRWREVDAANRRAELQRMEVAPAFLNGSGVAAAGATLASVVSDAARANGVRMGALEASGESAVSEIGGVARVRVRGDASGDVRAVTQFLAALEGGVPLISVRELSLTHGELNVAANRSDPLRIEFAIEALARFDPTETGK